MTTLKTAGYSYPKKKLITDSPPTSCHSGPEHPLRMRYPLLRGGQPVTLHNNPSPASFNVRGAAVIPVVPFSKNHSPIKNHGQLHVSCHDIRSRFLWRGKAAYFVVFQLMSFACKPHDAWKVSPRVWILAIDREKAPVKGARALILREIEWRVLH